ncbi:MAG: YlbF family regulator [Eubacterium sp.]|nr:YlbF family regulator [Eubacterium sp.]
MILEKCTELNNLIKASPEYRNYINARNAIKADENLYSSLMNFKQHYTDVMQYTEGNPYDEIYKIYNENDDLLHNSTVNAYLRAESAFSRLIRQVIGEVSKDINIEA